MISPDVAVLEARMVEEKMKHGIDGFEWLVHNNTVDPNFYTSQMEAIKLLCKMYKKDIAQVIKDALTMDEHEYYKAHEMCWHMSMFTFIDHFTLLKNQNYNLYFKFLQSIFGGVK